MNPTYLVFAVPKFTTTTEAMYESLTLNVLDPVAKFLPKVKLATITPFCLIPKVQPHPFAIVSDILTVMLIFCDVLGGGGGGGVEAVTSNKSTYLVIPQLLSLLMYAYPWSPHQVPQEFLMIHLSVVYPTRRTAWSIVTLLGQLSTIPVDPTYPKLVFPPPIPTTKGP